VGIRTGKRGEGEKKAEVVFVFWLVCLCGVLGCVGGGEEGRWCVLFLCRACMGILFCGGVWVVVVLLVVGCVCGGVGWVFVGGWGVFFFVVWWCCYVGVKRDMRR